MSISPNTANFCDATDASSMRWQFIDSSNNSRSNLTQVKRHVMQEYMRQKKSGTRQSESEEERPRVKRGRPKKTRGAKRRSERKPKPASDHSNNQPRGRRSARTQPAARTRDYSNIELRTDMSEDDYTSHAPLNESDDVPSVLPFQTSPTQSPAVPFTLDDFADLSPQSSQSHEVDFNSFSWSSAPTAEYQPLTSPVTILGAARTDSFNTLPIELDRDGQKPIDFYVTSMPAGSYEPQYYLPSAHNWNTSAFVPEEMKGETPKTLLHRDRAMTMLREHHSSSPSDVSDVAIASCLSAPALGNFDPQPGHKEMSCVHMRGAHEMLRARDGPAAFANNRHGMLIDAQGYALSGYESHRQSSFYDYEQPVLIRTEPLAPPAPQPFQGFNPILSPSCSTSSVFSEISPTSAPRPRLPSPLISSPIDEIKLQSEEFLDFLRRCEQLALYQRKNPDASYITRHTALQETSIIRQILDAPPGARFTTSGDREQSIARLTALMILNAALWDYRYTPARAAVFLNTLEKAMVDSEVGMGGSVEAILQILLECNDGSIESWPGCADGLASTALGDYPADFSQYYPTATSPSARPWFVGRMLKIARRLTAPSWYRVSELLFSCLTLQVQDSYTTFWEADLRQEILDAPLTSYAMSSLSDL